MLTFPLYIQFSFLFQVLIHVSISILLANNVYVISNIYFARATKYYLQLSTTYLTASYQFCPALASSLLLLVDQNLSSGGHKAWSSLTVILSECNCPRVLECPTRCLCLELPLYLRVISLKTSKERDFQVMNLYHHHWQDVANNKYNFLRVYYVPQKVICLLNAFAQLVFTTVLWPRHHPYPRFQMRELRQGAGE